MKKTKENILDTSRKLFNELGYSHVTIRMIASELKMSSGNLNYHFRKRDDILEALYFEMVSVFDQRVKELNGKTFSLSYIHSTMKSSMERMIDYRFVWTDLYFLLKTNEKIRTHFLNARRERISGYEFVFDVLIKTNILNKPSFTAEYSILMERMIDYSNTWLYASLLYEIKKYNAELLEDFSFRLLSMIYPYLTSAGKKEFRALFPHIFK